MNRDELLALPVSVDVPTAGKAFGISKLTAYRLAQTGDFPVPVIRVGRKLVVSQASLLAVLGIDSAQKGDTAAA
ncbi:helix-turn-helix transcriptional regulator [Micromonospora carbonacea]|uniref:helix-turn-helix transcriptional regulator n=1 Tax=Micromonospora carbonacea TaxID=47853 RepID=UPI0037162460